MASGVYVIRNTLTGSCYVGSAVNLKARLAAHKHSLRENRGAPPKLYRAWCKYGEAAFVFHTLIVCSRENTLLYEQLAIDAMKPRYNTRTLAHSNLGVRWTAATNQKKGRAQVEYVVAGVSGSLRHLTRALASVSYETVRTRVAAGWPVEKALLTPATSKVELGRAVAIRNSEAATHPNAKVFTVAGVTGSIKDLAEALSEVPVRAVRTRLSRGWSLEDALLKPRATLEARTRGLRGRVGAAHQAAKPLTVFGRTGSIKELAEHFEIPYPVVLKRLGKYGWAPERAFTTPVAQRKARV